ncbi:MAG: hypothetical protein UE295_12835, partial [Acutalibacteraceae bacterium]|nr:hypothetical protein [Acutalibacteraceae bacterium]
TEEAVEGKAPSCTETGLTAGTKCSVCGETLEAQKELPTIPHTEEAVEGKAPSCTETGLTAGTKCSVCGETVVKQEIIPATGHSYENGKCTVCGYNTPENTMTLYLKPSSNWQKDNARFTAYLWTGSKNTFIDMTDTDGDGYYELTAEKGWENIIFCRLSPKVETNWNNIWNQTKDLAILKDDRNCFTINEGAWDQADGKWSVYTPAPTVGIIGDIDLTLEETDDNIYTGVIELQAGTYKFNVDDNGTIRGMNFTYTDTATIDYSAGYKAATTLNVTGGRYTFTYNATAKKLTIKFKSFEDIVELTGDINAELVRPNKNTTVFTGTIRLDAGSYSFNVNEHGVIFGRGYTFEDTIYNAEFTFKAAATFNATGGVYSVRYDSSNNQLKILKAPEGLGDVSVFGDFSLPLAAQGNGVFSAQTILDAGSYDFRI